MSETSALFLTKIKVIKRLNALFGAQKQVETPQSR